MGEKLAKFLAEKSKIELGGGVEKIKKQHESGKLTARERLDLLFDDDTFSEYGLFVKHRCHNFGMEKVDVPAEAIVTGFGKINGRGAFAYAHDFTVMGGAAGEMQCKKIGRILEAALEAKVPFVGLNDSGGARIQEGVHSSYGDVFYHNVQASGVIPQISAIMGPCAGGATYSPALTDFTIAVDKVSRMFITGPEVIKAVVGEEVTPEHLGGAMTHNSVSGVAHLLAVDDYDCINQVKRLLSFLPDNCYEKPPQVETGDDPRRRVEEFNDFIPADPRTPYDVKAMIAHLVDNGDFFETQPYYAPNIVIGFARMNGVSVGIVANQPLYMAGCLDINASDKAARFIRTCDAYNVPLISLVDVPGYLPGSQQEHGGIIRHGAKMLYAWAEATVPKITVATGKVYGGAVNAMCSREMRADLILAWPTANRAVMGAEGGVNIIFRKEIKAAEDPEATRKKLIQWYEEEILTPYPAAGNGKFDEIIEPALTRQKIIACLEIMKNKQSNRIPRRHGNIPL
ncbi:MAG: acyl-CoA carboxylase subunit beta [Negativicutes bacterium]|nr:acyl-CoA carboxylase subunit beta [Negativicutes bacterium]